MKRLSGRPLSRAAAYGLSVPCPRQRKGEFPERHMGLTPFHEHPEVEQAIQASAAVAEQYLDLDALWEIACRAPMQCPDTGGAILTGSGGQTYQPVIGVIRDSAFQFYYPDNLEALEKARCPASGDQCTERYGACLISMPSISAADFPRHRLRSWRQTNVSADRSRQRLNKGLPIYAECGGLIYLGRSLTVGETIYPMTAVLPADFVLEKKPQAHGYTVLEAVARKHVP